MGHGNWATDRAYSGKVLGVYQSMVTFAQHRPRSDLAVSVHVA